MKNKKNQLRKKCKFIRNTLPNSSCSDKIVKIISNWDIYLAAKNIMLFYPINSEISLLKLLDDKSKSFYFPVVSSDAMFPVKYDRYHGFCSGYFNINEPLGERLEDYSILDLIFVPALAVDYAGCRLGYGKGYYDRFLSNICDSCIKSVPIYSDLVFDKLPKEKHDKECDFIVTEEQIIKITNRF
ncbi:MAG: 5-formyltetrahydrofolate cyclo-ligase [Clostridium sp.]|nr:5-formyltetrahydrofolate cyclo-ligase [Clostridium sp.]